MAKRRLHLTFFLFTFFLSTSVVFAADKEDTWPRQQVRILYNLSMPEWKWLYTVNTESAIEGDGSERVENVHDRGRGSSGLLVDYSKRISNHFGYNARFSYMTLKGWEPVSGSNAFFVNEFTMLSLNLGPSYFYNINRHFQLTAGMGIQYSNIRSVYDPGKGNDTDLNQVVTKERVKSNVFGYSLSVGIAMFPNLVSQVQDYYGHGLYLEFTYLKYLTNFFNKKMAEELERSHETDPDVDSATVVNLEGRMDAIQVNFGYVFRF